jgi:hypothetical protein
MAPNPRNVWGHPRLSDRLSDLGPCRTAPEVPTLSVVPGNRMPPIQTVVFDVGGVLIDWNPLDTSTARSFPKSRRWSAS